MNDRNLDAGARPDEPRASGARLVALGILLSKLGGLVREMVIARFFGVGPHGDVLRMALRAPNVLQNLLGEQTLSAAFIPFYSRMLAEGRREEAGRFAGAVFGLLVVTVSALVIICVLLAPAIVSVLAAGFRDDAAAGGVDRFTLTVRAVRIIFPMTGLLVLSAWALGVLNSHRRFLLPYLSPLVWNASIIAAMLAAAGGWPASPEVPPAALERWLFAACFGALAGGLAQLGVQLPLALRLMRGFRPSLSRRVAGVREAFAAFGPALAGRGVVQVSAYVDLFLASWLATGAPSALGYAVMLINLPLAAFGMSVAAAELPELSSSDPATAGRRNAGRRIAERVDRALRQSIFLLAPSVVGYLAFGFLVAGLVFRGGSFTVEGNLLVCLVLAGYTLGLLPSVISRLLQNTFYALRDTRTPARIAGVRLLASASAGVLLMSILDRYTVTQAFGLESATQNLYLGAVGLAIAAALGSWCELALLRRALSRRLPELRLPFRYIAGRLGLAATLAVPGLILWAVVPADSVKVQALVVLPAYALCYLGVAWWARTPELDLWLGRLRAPRTKPAA